MIKKIYLFGNPLLKKDEIPIALVNQLKQKFPFIKFLIADPNENFPPEDEKELIILDTVLGIEKPMILDLDDFEKKRKTPVSPHDYDLLFHLLLLKKIKKIKSVKIIGLPVIKNQKNNSFLLEKISQLLSY